MLTPTKKIALSVKNARRRDEKLLNRLEELKNITGINTDTDMVRYCVKYTHDRVKKENRKFEETKL